jgi:hypothetical protein
MNKTGNGIRPKSMDQDKPREPETSRLVDAVRRVRIASADKSDVVVEMRDAVRTRLELLAQDLKPVIEDIPPDDDRFDFALSSGLEPRFWIDATAHVMMGPDRRTYRFVRDTRLGRILLAESANRDEVAERVISYIAMRIHERELAFSGDTISYRELVTGRAIDHDADDMVLRRQERLRHKIEQAVAELPGGASEAEAEVPAKAPTPVSAPPVERAAPDQGCRFARAVAAGLFWILFGAALSAGTLLYVFRDMLAQR